MKNISKKLIITIGFGILVSSCFTACGSKSDSNNNTNKNNKKTTLAETTLNTQTTQTNKSNNTSNTNSLPDITMSTQSDGNSKSQVDNEWKSAYANYINNNLPSSDFEQFALIYVDNNEIPELVAIGNCEAIGCKICCYSNKEVTETQLGRLYFTYIEKKNLLCNSDGNMSHYYDVIFSINNGKLTKLAEGNYEIVSDSSSENNNISSPSYVYKWNDKNVSESEYKESLSKIYDQNLSVPGYDENNTYTRQAIIDFLQK